MFLQPRLFFLKFKNDFISILYLILFVSPGFNHSECSGEPYFSCRNGKCIPMSLVCADDKGIDNCGDGSDLIDYPGCNGQ